MKYALINTETNTIDTISMVYKEDWVEVPDYAYAGWSWDGSAWIAPVVPITSQDVDSERNRRMRSTITFNGIEFACDEDSLQRITGAATLAGFALGAGYGPEDYYWHGGASPFTWIANDNSFVQMDAPTCFAFGQAAAANETAHIFAARALKDLNPIPVDYKDDSYWP